eukprot:ANDGO_04866.mRNA.1 hypothetical protein GUITHDRAFT_102791
MHILLTCVEVFGTLFSGNSYYTRSLLSGLLEENSGVHVTVVCGIPERDVFGTWKTSDKLYNHPRLNAVLVPVPIEYWFKVDAGSCYQIVADVLRNEASRASWKQAFSAGHSVDYALVMDFTGHHFLQAALEFVVSQQSRSDESLCRKHGPPGPWADVARPPSILFFLRVFAMSRDHNEDLYRRLETRARLESSTTLVLSEPDRRFLETECSLAQHKQERIVTLCPPLRNELFLLAQNMPVVRRRARGFLLAVCRVSPEKNTRIFFEIVKKLRDSGALDRLRLVPLLCGAVSDSRYYEEHCKADIDSGLVIHAQESHPQALAWIYSHAAVLIHPAIQDSFGMVVPEAAVFGCPVIASNQGVGALEVFPKAHPLVTTLNYDADDVPAIIERAVTKTRQPSMSEEVLDYKPFALTESKVAQKVLGWLADSSANA